MFIAFEFQACNADRVNYIVELPIWRMVKAETSVDGVYQHMAEATAFERLQLPGSAGKAGMLNNSAPITTARMPIG